MRFAAPETSNSCPIMTPKPKMVPMLPRGSSEWDNAPRISVYPI